jgi:hypothetical protein
MKLTPCGFISYRSIQTLHKAVNAALKLRANNPDPDFNGYKFLRDANPYVKKGYRKRWFSLAVAMYGVGRREARYEAYS